MVIRFSDLGKVRLCHAHSAIVLVGGCYDLLHVGHIAFLEQCHTLGDVLVVVVSSDIRVRERKGANRPIISEADRVTMLAALSVVDYALVAPNPTPAQNVPTVRVIHALKPDTFVTSDERFHEYSESLKRIGTQVKYVPRLPLTSTTDIIKRICGC